MINTLNTNSKVAKLDIVLSSDDRWNNRILTFIANNYTNVYHIEVHDWNW